MDDVPRVGAPEPGWYQDPLAERWWDGTGWTQITRRSGDEHPGGASVTTSGEVPPGWHPDPLAERRWNGDAWTSDTRVTPEAPEAGTPAAPDATFDPPALPDTVVDSIAEEIPPPPILDRSPTRRKVNLGLVIGSAAGMIGVAIAVAVLIGSREPDNPTTAGAVAPTTADVDPVPGEISAPTSSVEPVAATTATTTPPTTPPTSTSTTTSTTSTTTTSTTTSTSTTTTTTVPNNLSDNPYFDGLSAWTRSGAEQMLEAAVTRSPAWGYAQHLRQSFRAGASPQGIASLRDLEPGVAELCIGNTCPQLSDVSYVGGRVDSFSVDGLSIDQRSRGWRLDDVTSCWYVGDFGCSPSLAAEMHLTSVYRFRNTTYVSVELENGGEFPTTVEYWSASVTDRSGSRSDSGDVTSLVAPGETKVWLVTFGDVDVSTIGEIVITASFGGDLYDFVLEL